MGAPCSKPHSAGPEPTISVKVVRELVAAVERADVPRQRFLQLTNLSAESLETLDGRVPRSEALRYCESAFDVTDDPAFGLHWAEWLTTDSFTVVSHLLTHAANLRQAFDALSQFGGLLTDQLEFQLTERGDDVVVRRFASTGVSLRLRRLIAEMAVLGLQRLVRQFNPHASFKRVSFDYPAPSYHTEYARVFGSEICFDEPFSGLVFDRALMDAPSPHKDEDLQRTLKTLAEQRMWRQRAPYSSRVREVLLQQPAPHRVAAETVARSLDLSVRSLRRRLAEEGLSYTAIANEASATLAKRLLLDEQRSIQEAAYAMEFSDASSFHRAFKRWTGNTPRTFRDQR